MNVQQSRRNSASSVVVSRFAALEKLRRLIFAPVRRRVGVVALAALLAGTSAFAQTEENKALVFDPTNDITIREGDSLTVYNDQRDLKSGDNDPSKTITLDGGTFSFDSETVSVFGPVSNVKNWTWGSNGGTIKIDNYSLVFYETIGCTDETQGVKGVSLTKSGAGRLLFINKENEDVSYIDDLTIEGTPISIFGMLNLGIDSSEEKHSKVKLDSSLYVIQYGNIIFPDIRIDSYLYYPWFYGLGGVQIDKEKFVDIVGGDSDQNFRDIRTLGTSFNSEGKLSISGFVGIHTNDIGTYRALNLNLYDVDIISSGENDKKMLDLAVMTVSEGVEEEVDKNGIINLFGTINIDGGDSQNRGQRNAKLQTTGKTVISGTVINQNGGVAVHNGHVTLSGQYVSESVTSNKDDSPMKQYVADMFRSGLTITDYGILIAKDFGLDAAGDLEIEGNGHALIYGTSFFGSNEERHTTIKLSENGALYGSCENVDADTVFNYGGKLVLGNFNYLTDGSANHTYMVTEDEYQRKTSLKMNLLRNTIVTLHNNQAKNQQDYVHGSPITGTGTIEINTPVGYSVDGKNVTTYVALMSGDKTGFTGNTEVRLGSFSLECSPETGDSANRSSFQYGNEKKRGVFNVYGETQGIVAIDEEGNKTIIDQGTNGQLVFWRPNANKALLEDGTLVGTATLGDAPILYADQVNFLAGDGGTEKGAKLFFNTFFKERSFDSEGKLIESAPNDKARNLGTISANEINFSSNNYVWYETVSNLTSSATMTITLESPEITIDGAKIDASNVSDLEDLFGKPLVSTKATQIDGGGYKIEANTRNVESYAIAEGMTQKEQDYAAKIDANRIAGKDLNYYDALYNENDAVKVRQTIHNLSIGGYQMLNAYGHFGNPTSSFFGGSTISGEHKRAQSLDPDYDPLEERDRQAEQQSAIANAPVDDASRAIWGAYTNTTVDGDEYDSDGITMNGYRLRRQGIVGGLRRQIDGSTSGGLFFGLSNPEINSTGEILGGYGNYGSRMEMDDFQFAGHFEKIVGDFWEIAAYVGGGTQSMDWRRDLYLNEGGRYRFEADGAGNTLTGTLYLANRIDLSENATFRPTIGVDSEHSWLYGFDEIQTVGGKDDEVNAYMRWLAQSYAYDQTYYNRNTARAGARFNWSGSAGIAGLNAQAFYAVKLGGKDAPLISYRSQNYSFDNMETHAMGNESFSVGGGGFLNLNRAKTLTATGDFNAVWYKNATTQNVTGGLTYRF